MIGKWRRVYLNLNEAFSENRSFIPECQISFFHRIHRVVFVLWIVVICSFYWCAWCIYHFLIIIDVLWVRIVFPKMTDKMYASLQNSVKKPTNGRFLWRKIWKAKVICCPVNFVIEMSSRWTTQEVNWILWRINYQPLRKIYPQSVKKGMWHRWWSSWRQWQRWRMNIRIWRRIWRKFSSYRSKWPIHCDIKWKNWHRHLVYWRRESKVQPHRHRPIKMEMPMECLISLYLCPLVALALILFSMSLPCSVCSPEN